MTIPKERAREPTYATRAWLTTLLAQTQAARIQVKNQLDIAQDEASRLTIQLERADGAIAQLQAGIDQIDSVLKARRYLPENQEIAEHSSESTVKRTQDQAVEEDAAAKPTITKRSRSTK